MGWHSHRRDLLPRYRAWLHGLGARDLHGHIGPGFGAVGRDRNRRSGGFHSRFGSRHGSFGWRNRQRRDGRSATGATSYFVDALFRPTDPSRLAGPGAEGDAAAVAQASRILVMGAAAGDVSAEDKAYLGQLVAARTGLSQADATARVDQVLAQVKATKVKAQEAADAARKAGATFALVGALSLIIGAFIAGAAAALGGTQRDDEETVYLTARG